MAISNSRPASNEKRIRRMSGSFFSLTAILLCTLGTLGSAQQSPSGLELYNFRKSSARQVPLTKPLKEISGLAVTDDGRLFAHHDEGGEIFQIDPVDGSILKRFTLGVADDFEGIAVVGQTFYLVTSSGVVYLFREGKDGEKVPFNTYATSLTEEYDVEGLCYDPVSDALLLACKGYSGLKFIGFKAIFAFPLKTKKLSREPVFLLSVKELEQALGKRSFRPSGIEYNARTKSFFVLDSDIRSIAEISRQGKIINTVRLDHSIHKQPEGITFGAKGELLISDEGVKLGTLTIYPLQR